MKKNYSKTKDKIILNTPDGNKKFSINSQIGCTLEVLINNLNKKVSTGDVTSKASTLYKKRTGKDYKELTGRHLRTLRERGLIVSTDKGVFKFTGEYSNSKSNPFSKKIIDEIIRKDKYTCQQCGLTKKAGALLTADHILPQDKGGQATLDNGMCLCTSCQNRKNKLGVYDYGKKVHQKSLKKCKKEGLSEEVKFHEEILEVFERYPHLSK